MVMAALAAALGLAPAMARGQERDRRAALGVMWEAVQKALDAASDAREPRLVPPQPVTVRWQARRISSIGLDGPLLGLGAGDLDGDERDELIVLTTTEVVIVEHRGHRRLEVRGRAALPDEPAPIRPRDAVGTLVVSDLDGNGRAEIAARSSEQARGAVYGLGQAGLVELHRLDGFPVCPGVVAELEPGRHYFTVLRMAEMMPGPSQAAGPGPGQAASGRAGSLLARVAPEIVAQAPKRFFSARCQDRLVDATGRELAIMAIAGQDGTLQIWQRPRCQRRDTVCQGQDMVKRAVADAGVAFEIADVDRDGHAEVVMSAPTPPGDPDQVTVVGWKDDKQRRLFSREFSGGVVGLAAGDIDGDGIDDVVAAVRLWGSNRVDIWTFYG